MSYLKEEKELEIEYPCDLDISFLSIHPRTVSIPQIHLHIHIILLTTATIWEPAKMLINR